MVKLAVKPKYQPENSLSPWEAILNEILNGDTFGVDRMDYLLRDSHHAGVPYGRFDPLRLLDSLVVIPSVSSSSPTGAETPSPAADDQEHQSKGQTPEYLTLGIEAGSIQGAEALLLARYFMYSQVYFHHVRRAYDLHLKDFLVAWLGERGYPVDVDGHLRKTDNEVLKAIAESAEPSNKDCSTYDPAVRIQSRNHFRRALSLRQSDWKPADGGNPQAPELIQRALDEEFGNGVTRVDCVIPGPESKSDIVLLTADGEPVSGLDHSDVLNHIPEAWCANVLADKTRVKEVSRYLERNKDSILHPK